MKWIGVRKDEEVEVFQDEPTHCFFFFLPLFCKKKNADMNKNFFSSFLLFSRKVDIPVLISLTKIYRSSVK